MYLGIYFWFGIIKTGGSPFTCAQVPDFEKFEPMKKFR